MTAGLIVVGAGAAAADDSYTVESGDTLASIAADHDEVSSWRVLADVNADTVDNPNLIFVGQELALSSASSPASSSSPAPASEPAEEATPATGGNVSVATWDRVAECESNGDWSINTGNGYYGGLQFALSSWQWVGGTGMPHEASKSEQIARAEILLERQGWVAWPACSRQLGLR